MSKSRGEKRNLRTGLPERKLLVQLLTHHIDTLDRLLFVKSPSLQEALVREEKDVAHRLLDQILE